MQKNEYRQTKMLLLLGMILVSLFSCSFRDICQDSEIGSGIVITETRDIAYFHSVTTIGSCQVFFAKNSVQKVILEGEHNILPLIRTRVGSDGTLIIEPKKSYQTKIGVKAYISMREIRGFKITGSGTVESEYPFSCDELNLAIIGSGQMNINVNTQEVFSAIAGSGGIFLSGNAGFNHSNISGSGYLNSLDLVASDCEVKTSGSGNSYVHARDILEVWISGSGNVYYKGNPAVIQSHFSGSGELIKLD